MNKQIIDLWMMENINKFSSEKKEMIKEKMYTIDEEEFSHLCQEEFKDYYSFLAIGSFLGFFGVDRFLLNDQIFGFIKLIAFIIYLLFYGENLSITVLISDIFLIISLIFCIYDLVTMKKRIQNYNFEKLVNFFKTQNSLNKNNSNPANNYDENSKTKVETIYQQVKAEEIIK